MTSLPDAVDWVVKDVTACRLCHEPLPAPYLDLGEQPLANALVGPASPDNRQDEARFPLRVCLCPQCSLSQLTVTVNPDVLYGDYRFRAGTSPLWQEHCQALAKQIDQCFGIGTVLDIAANDGTQLDAFFRRGWLTFGVDVAPVDCTLRPYIEQGLWSERYAKDWKTAHGEATVVIAQNVLGHVDDPIGFLRGVRHVLAENGVAIIEVPHVGELLTRCAFDTIYHEHLSYWSLGPLQRAARHAGLKVVKVEHLTTHGGSRRYWLKPGVGRPEIDPSVGEEQKAEFAAKLWSLDTYEAFAGEVGSVPGCVVYELVGRGRIVGWGASAKASVMLNSRESQDGRRARSLVTAIIDETPEKQGFLMPGVHIPIIPPPDDLSDVGVLWVLSWNNEAAIRAKAKARGFRGQFLITSPTVRLEH